MSITIHFIKKFVITEPDILSNSLQVKWYKNHYINLSIKIIKFVINRAARFGRWLSELTKFLIINTYCAEKDCKSKIKVKSFIFIPMCDCFRKCTSGNEKYISCVDKLFSFSSLFWLYIRNSSRCCYINAHSWRDA